MISFKAYLLAETYTLHLNDDEDALIVRRKDGQRIEVRGADKYPIKHQPNDHLHQFLDSLDPATISKLMSGDSVYLNPHNSRTLPSIRACDILFQNNR